MSLLLTHGLNLLATLQESTGADKTFWFPEQASTIAESIEDVFYFIYWVSVISFVLVIGATVLFAWRYRSQEGKRAIKTSTHDNTLEVTWTLIPTALVAVMFWVGFKGFLDLRSAPENAYEVQVTGFQWAWAFTYPNGFESNELHVPADRPVRLLMTSTDVLHSLFIPAFRVKQDVVPGRYTSLWFEANRPGVFDLFCTEYCGTSHSGMITKTVVHEDQAAFEAWLTEASNVVDTLPPIEAGLYTYEKKGCTQCHLPTKEWKLAPGFGIVSEAIATGGSVEFEDGTAPLVPDENYLRESILNPNAKIRAGAAGQRMPAYQGRLKESEINGLIAWIKSLHAAQ